MNYMLGIKKFDMANYKLKSILLLVKVFLLTNDLFTNKKDIIEMRKISYYEVLELLI